MHCEDPAVADALEAEGRAVVRWRERNLYFGGVSAVEVPRRRRSPPPATCAAAERAWWSRDARFHSASGGSGRRGGADASRGSGERGAGGLADLGERRVAQRRRRAALSEGAAALSECRGVRRGAKRRRDHRAAVARARYASRERACRRSRPDGREGRAPAGRGAGAVGGRRRVGARQAACGSSSCTSSRGTSRRSSFTSGSVSSAKGFGRGTISVAATTSTRS